MPGITGSSEFQQAFGGLFEHSSDGVIIGTPGGVALKANASACRMLGRSEEEILRIGRDGLLVNDAAYREWAATRTRDGLARGRLQFRRGDGSTFPADATSALVPGPGGESYVYVVFRDVAAEERVQEELRERADELDTILRTALDGCWMLDLGARLVYVNDAICRMLGYAREEMVGRPLSTFEALENQEAAVAHAGKIERERADRFDSRLRRKDGAVIEVEVSARVLPFKGGRIVAFLRDVTEERKLAANLAVSSRLAALGTLVAGIAHEVNNPLAGALASQGFAAEEVRDLREALRKEGRLDPDAAARTLDAVLEALSEGMDASQRVARIVRDLNLFGKPDPARALVQLNRVVEEALRWLPASVAGRATLRVELAELPDIRVSPSQIQQVVINLVTNAARSIPADRMGTVTIRTLPGSQGSARIEVEDDGVGMPGPVLDRIFDPFFTTRRAGEGMGLGLPVCHAIVTAHGGSITVESTPGRGSTFRIDLPTAAPVA